MCVLAVQLAADKDGEIAAQKEAAEKDKARIRAEGEAKARELQGVIDNLQVGVTRRAGA